MVKICLDAGHGFNTAGKRIPNGGKREWELNSGVCSEITKMLSEYEDVQVVRTDDITGNTDVSLANRINIAKSVKPLVLISIHHNAGGNGSAFGNFTGVSSFVRTNARPDSIKIATEIAQKLSEYSGLRNRGGGQRSEFYMTTVCDFPTLLVEGGFMDGVNDSKVIVTDQWKKQYAKAVVDVLVANFSLKKKVIVTQQPVQNTNTTTNGITHTIVRGDTLWDLARKYNTTVANIQKLNPNVNANALKIGDKLVITQGTVVNNTTTQTVISTPQSPTPTQNVGSTYTVKHGDSLSKIASLYNGVTWQEIAQINNIKAPKYIIRTGDVLKIPSKASTTSSTSNSTVPNSIKVGSRVRVKKNAKTFTGGNVAPFVYNNVYTVDQLNGKRALLDQKGIRTPFNVDDLILV